MRVLSLYLGMLNLLSSQRTIATASADTSGCQRPHTSPVRLHQNQPQLCGRRRLHATALPPWKLFACVARHPTPAFLQNLTILRNSIPLRAQQVFCGSCEPTTDRWKFARAARQLGSRRGGRSHRAPDADAHLTRGKLPQSTPPFFGAVTQPHDPQPGGLRSTTDRTTSPPGNRPGSYTPLEDAEIVDRQVAAEVAAARIDELELHVAA